MDEAERGDPGETIEQATSGRPSEHEREVVDIRSAQEGTDEPVWGGADERHAGDTRTTEDAQDELERERRGIEEDA